MEKIVESYLMMHEMSSRLYCTASSPEVLLEALHRSDDTGLYFLDIDLKAEMNGINLAQEIRLHDPRGYIVFITTHSEMTTLTFQYKAEAMDFILKDEPDKLQERIFTCIENSSNDSRKVILHTAEGVSRVTGSLKVLSTSLSPHFVRCSQSVFANIEHVVSFTREYRVLHMDNEETCKASIRMTPGVLRAMRR